jgi:hypothetical protein
VFVPHYKNATSKNSFSPRSISTHELLSNAIFWELISFICYLCACVCVCRYLKQESLTCLLKALILGCSPNKSSKKFDETTATFCLDLLSYICLINDYRLQTFWSAIHINRQKTCHSIFLFLHFFTWSIFLGCVVCFAVCV